MEVGEVGTGGVQGGCVEQAMRVPISTEVERSEGGEGVWDVWEGVEASDGEVRENGEGDGEEGGDD